MEQKQFEKGTLWKVKRFKVKKEIGSLQTMQQLVNKKTQRELFELKSERK